MGWSRNTSYAELLSVTLVSSAYDGVYDDDGDGNCGYTPRADKGGSIWSTLFKNMCDKRRASASHCIVKIHPMVAT
jgi:hypothetical protein